MAKSLLVIDNDPACLEMTTEALQYHDFEVHADTGQGDILHRIKESKPDLLLIDYLLDGVNGGEICAQLKRDEQYNALPVIIFSAYPKVLQSLGDYGCDFFLPKPFDLSELVDQVNRLLAYPPVHL